MVVPVDRPNTPSPASLYPLQSAPQDLSHEINPNTGSGSPYTPYIRPKSSAVTNGAKLTLVSDKDPSVSALDAIGKGGSVQPTQIKARTLAPAQISAARAAEQKDRGIQVGLMPTLRSAAMGQAPSAAQIAGRASLAQQSLAQEQAAAAVRGGASGIYAAQRASATGLGGVQAGVMGASAANREAELVRAQDVLAKNLLATRTGDIGMTGTDATVASRNADLVQTAALSNQHNQLVGGEANLNAVTNASGLDLNDQIRSAIARQQAGMQTQEARDARAITRAGEGFDRAQTDAMAIDAANAGYLGDARLGLEGSQLQAGQAVGNTARDAAFYSGLLTGGAAPIALASIPSAPAPQPIQPQQAYAPAPLAPAPAPAASLITPPTLQLQQPLPSPQQMYAAYGGGY